MEVIKPVSLSMACLQLLSSVLVIGLLCRIFQTWNRKKKDEKFALSNGCLPGNLLSSSYFMPLGLDKLKITVEADRARRLPPFMLAEFEKHGHTYTQNTGGRYVILTREPENIKAILSNPIKSFAIGINRRKTFFPLVGDSIFTQEGVAGSHSRALLRPQFKHVYVKDTAALEKHVQNLLTSISKCEKKTENNCSTLDISPLLFSFTLDYSTEFLFGESVGALDTGATLKDTELAEAFNTAMNYLGERARLSELYWLAGGRTFMQSCNMVRKFARTLVDKALSDRVTSSQSSKKSNVFLEGLLEESSDPEVILNHLLSILLAGRDTTAGFIGWILYCLVRDPHVQQKLRREIIQLLGEKKLPTSQELSSAAYLQSVLHETLRMFPIAPLNARDAVSTTSLPRGGGPDGLSPILVPEGTKVAYNIFCLHRRKDIYGEDANTFRPERWLDEDRFQGGRFGWSFLPFNQGPRACLGKDLALTEAAYTICRLIQSFELMEPAINPEESEDSIPIDRVYGLDDGISYALSLTLAPANGVWLRLKPNLK